MSSPKMKRSVWMMYFWTAKAMPKFLGSGSSFSRLIPESRISDCLFWVSFWKFGIYSVIFENNEILLSAYLLQDKRK